MWLRPVPKRLRCDRRLLLSVVVLFSGIACLFLPNVTNIDRRGFAGTTLFDMIISNLHRGRVSQTDFSGDRLAEENFRNDRTEPDRTSTRRQFYILRGAIK